ncbi:MAG: ASKHA domain-containing protein [Geobacteraceae bacterium]|nr:ASKHA domain-containing protein [Geobacteraceae bacterium]
MSDRQGDDKKLMFALDMGTTTLTGQLLDQNGSIRARATVFNPQQEFGPDIIRRLEHASTPEGRQQLRDALMRGTADILALLCKNARVQASTIHRAVAAGNSGITILARGGDGASLLRPPYRPDSCAGVNLSVPELEVPLYLFPLVGGYVGGDLLAVLYALKDPVPGSLIVDVGTNAEIALFDGARWLATSVAAGPAFEGGNISCGMPAQEGAVRGVHVENERFCLDIVPPQDKRAGAVSPRGLCGSAVVETLAAALEHGLVGCDGTIAAPDAVDLRLTQEDIRQLQLAKGAVYAGAECLMQRAGLEPAALERVYITGALGSAMRPEMLNAIAMLPEYMIKKVEFVRNGVLYGLVRFLCSEEGDMEVENLRRQIRLYPLSGTPAFERAFVKALNFCNNSPQG